MIDILLVDDHQVVLDGLRYYFENSDRYNIKDTATNGYEVLSLLEHSNYDIIISDISMPQMNGMELVENIRQKDQDQKILMMTMLGEAQHIKKMLALGINGYLLKNSKQDELFKAIDSIIDGENYFAEEVTKTIINDYMGQKTAIKDRFSYTVQLTQREMEVLELVVQEYSNQEIADKLFISPRTVEGHKHNLIEKTGAKNIAGLVMYAVDNKLFTDQKVN